MNHSSTPRKTAAPEDCLVGGGEMGALMRAIDWARTPLGPVRTWPESLRTAISIMLASRFAMVVAWGPEFRFLYNDRYRPVLGASKHPRALGTPARDIFPEAWPFIGPLFESTLQGEAVAFDDVLIPLDRYGYLENCYFTLSYSPIRDETGQVGGMLAVVAETTERVQGERRLQSLRDLARRAAEAQTVDGACANAVAVLAANPIDVPFALLYLLDPDGTCARLAAMTGLAPDPPVSPRAVDLRRPDCSDGWPLAAVVHAPQLLVLPDLLERFGPLPSGLYPEPTHTAVLLPLVRPGQPYPDGILVFGVSPRRVLDEPYRGFYELAADHILTAIRNARAYAEERQRAEALAELNRAKTAFFSNVSHEFRTPLTLMLGPLEDLLVQATQVHAPADPSQLELIYRNALRLLKLVNTLLDFSRIEAGRVQAVYEPTDLAACTAELASMFRSAIERAGLRLGVDCPPLPAPVYVDRDMWEKIVLNLLSNAFKFTFAGEIAVALCWVGDHVALTVRDTGTGIPAEEMAQIFTRFHRVRGAQARTHEGTGIGLALVQELVKLHGGTVTVTSTVGEGSTFTVTLPTSTAHLPVDRIGAQRTLASTATGAAPYLEETLRWLPNEEEAVPGRALLEEPMLASTTPVSVLLAGPQAPPPQATARILLADDNADMRQYLTRILRQRWHVDPVADGAGALAAARARTPDLVLTDVMMPGLDGFELLRALRADARTREVPVLLLSARAGEESRVEGLEAGADDYLIKPFSARELLARVGSHLELARLRREAAAALRASEQQFRSMADTAPVMLWVTDATGAYTFLSRSWYEFTGQTEATGLGAGWLDAVHPDDRAAARATFLAANAQRHAFRLDYRVRRADGVYRWTMNAGQPRVAASGEFLGYIGSVIDIDDRKQAEAALQQAYAELEQRIEERTSALRREMAKRRRLEHEAERAQHFTLLGRLAAGVSHEIRNPLGAIFLYVDVLEEELRQPSPDSPAEIVQALAEIKTQLARLDDLVQDYLSLVRVAAIDRTPQDLGAAVQAWATEFQALATLQGVTLQCEGIATLGLVAFHASTLRRALLNLVQNALEAMPQGGTVTIAGTSGATQVQLQVRDTGSGIPAGTLAQIFEPLYTTKPGGTGLGLYIVQEIVAAHGGQVTVQSCEGQGTTFTLTLPGAAAELPAPTLAPTDGAALLGGPPRADAAERP